MGAGWWILPFRSGPRIASRSYYAMLGGFLRSMAFLGVCTTTSDHQRLILSAARGNGMMLRLRSAVDATERTGEAIYMWFFPRGQIPEDLDQGNTYTWGPPYVTFPFYNCPSWHFNDQQLVINLDFCGDWAGSVFPGGNDACIEYVQNPANIEALSDAYWAINYVKVLF